MIEEKMRKLVDRLLTKTKQAEVAWSETPVEGAYQVSFPNYSVGLDNESGPIVVRIYNSEGKIVNSITQDEIVGKEDASLGNFYYEEMLKELYASAREQARGSDNAIDEILKNLG